MSNLDGAWVILVEWGILAEWRIWMGTGVGDMDGKECGEYDIFFKMGGRVSARGTSLEIEGY